MHVGTAISFRQTSSMLLLGVIALTSVLDDDGLDDYICISTNGEISVSYNKGGNPPTFDSVGKIGDAPAFWADGYTVDCKL